MGNNSTHKSASTRKPKVVGTSKFSNKDIGTSRVSGKPANRKQRRSEESGTQFVEYRKAKFLDSISPVTQTKVGV